ncbi:Ditrans,polycis-undecaprenyl-diphosphate synthase ((2E,6E)-farnesyl-diphosphate specific) [subsurface metagenome]
MKFPNHLNHIAIIMDGNRRWSQLRGLPSLAGHRAGLKSMHSTGEYLGNCGLKYLTVYGFSTENWNRAPDEVEGLFQLFTETKGVSGFAIWDASMNSPKMYSWQ